MKISLKTGKDTIVYRKDYYTHPIKWQNNIFKNCPLTADIIAIEQTKKA